MEILEIYYISESIIHNPLRGRDDMHQPLKESNNKKRFGENSEIQKELVLVGKPLLIACVIITIPFWCCLESMTIESFSFESMKQERDK